MIVDADSHIRPWRLSRPQVPEGAIRRPRLLTAVHQRWHRPLVSITAGAGFGKTTLLAQAISENELDPAGSDVYVRALPADAAAAGFARSISAALNVDAPPGDDSAPGLSAHIHDALWARAPDHVSLIIDDAHLALADDGAAALVASVLRHLPINAHLVIASRNALPAPVLGHSPATTVHISDTDLLFDPDELDELDLASRKSGGWPAAVGLAAAGRGDDITALLRSTLGDLEDEVREALVVTALLGGADAALLEGVGIPPAVLPSLAELPLVSATAQQWVTVHDLWTETVETTTPEPRRRELLRQGAEALHEQGLHEEAFTAAANARAWDLALDIARDIGSSYAAEVRDPELLDRWRAMLPASMSAEPGALLIEALAWRFRDPWHPRGVAAGRSAAEGFRHLGNHATEVAALVQAAYLAFVQADQVGLADIVSRVTQLDADGVSEAAPYAAMGRAVVHDALGDDAAALADLSVIDLSVLRRDWIAVVEWLSTNALLMLGRHEEARVHGERAGMLALRGFGGFVGARDIARWFDGYPDVVLREELPDVHSARDRFFLGTNAASGRAAAGRTDEARALFALARSRENHLATPADEAAVALAEASIALSELREHAAAESLQQFLDRHPLAHGPVERALRNRLALVYVLCPETRDFWEAAPLGPGWQVGVSLARAIVRGRASGADAYADLPWPRPGLVFAHLGLVHACEMAAVGVAAGRPEAQVLARWLADELGPRVQEVLHHLARVASGPVASGARSLVATIPARPDHPLRICVLGPAEIRIGGELAGGDVMRRERVRALLTILVTRRREQRERLASLLWPTFTSQRAFANLRTTLNYLQSALEPRRSPGDPPFHLRVDGNALGLVASDLLRVDVWEFDEHVSAAREAERAGLTADVLTHLRAACELWRGEPFAEFVYEDWAAGTATRLRADFVWAATRAAELLLVTDRTDEAIDLGNRALAEEPLSEPTYRAVASAYMARDERSAAWRIIEACVAALDEAGLEPQRETTELRARLASSPSGQG